MGLLYFKICGVCYCYRCF